MQSDSRSHEPRLATLFALVGGIFCLTGVGVASYLAEDAARAAAPVGACAGAAGEEREGAGLTRNGTHCGDLTEATGRRGRVPVTRVKVG